jgi:hypothetical protein
MTTIWPGTTYTGDAAPYTVKNDIIVNGRVVVKAGRIVGPFDTYNGALITELDAAATAASPAPTPAEPDIPGKGRPVEPPVRAAGAAIPDRETAYTPPRVTGTPPSVQAAIRAVTPAAGTMPKMWLPPAFRNLTKRSGRSTPTRRHV